jgi:hypothetical protein
MRRHAVVCLVSACGGTATTPASPVPPATVVEVAAPALPRADFVVVPAELADEGVLARIPHRVRIRRIGTSWLREGGTATARSGDQPERAFVLPVLDETPDKIRVAFEDDSARLALWIARADAWDTLAVPIQLADRDGKARRDAGVWVARGAPLDLARREGARTRVRVRDELVEVMGFVPDRVVTKVWIAGEGDAPASFVVDRATTWTMPKDPRPQVRFVSKAQVLAAPGGASIATIVDAAAELIGFVGDEASGFRGVEIVRPHMRIKGFVRVAELVPVTDELGTFGTIGTGHGFGMSHADKIELPAGTCLYDLATGGSVVGVQSKPSTRLGQKGARWSRVHVGTYWSITSVYVQDVGDDPKQPTWESCTQPAVRK